MERWSVRKIIGFAIWILLIITSAAIIITAITNPRSDHKTAAFNDTKSLTLLAQSNASLVRQSIDSYYSNKKSYPNSISQLLSGITIAMPKGISLLDTSTEKLTAKNGKTKVWYQYSTENGAVTGGRIRYWDFSTHKISDDIMYVGDALVESSFVDIR